MAIPVERPNHLGMLPLGDGQWEKNGPQELKKEKRVRVYCNPGPKVKLCVCVCVCVCVCG
jgi:hypothetical protein